MTALQSPRAGVFVIGSAVVALSSLVTFGWGAMEPQISTPDCSSCDARHARLAHLRAAGPDATE
jgi:hypothetical protein